MARRFTLSAGFQLRAADAAAAPKKVRRFEMVAYTGGPMNLDGFDLPVVVDLTGLETHSPQRPMLADHTPTRDNVAGQSDRIAVVSHQLVIEGDIYVHRPCGKDIADLADVGFRWQASIGADIPTPEDLEELAEGQTAEVNGRTITGPCYIARRTVLGETSFVVMGADDRTSARIAASRRKARAQARGAKGSAMPSFEEFCRSLGLDPAAMSADQQAAARSAYTAVYGPPGETTANDDEEQLTGEGDDEELTAEGDEEDVTAGDDEEPQTAQSRRASARQRGGQSRVRAGTRPRVSAYARGRAREVRHVAALEAACAGHPKILAQALEGGWSLDKAHLEVLRASRASAPRPQGGGGTLHGPSADLLEAALLMSLGIKAEKVAKWYGEKTTDQATSKNMRGVTLHYAMDRVIEASGEFYRGSRKTNAFINATLAAERKTREIRASSGFTTLSLSSILENVANKVLVDAYEAQKTAWQAFAAVRSHSDFKVASRYRLDATGAFRPVGPDGELEHIGLENAKYTNQVDTFGAIISLTRQMQINDDLDAFAQVPQAHGRLGATAVEEETHKLLLSNPSNFFHANNRNLLTGATSAFSIGGLTLMEQLFLDQIDTNKKPTLISPAVLLLPTTLKTEGDNIYTEVTVNETTTADKPKVAKNPHKGKWQPVASTYLNNTGIRDRDGKVIAGQSSTGWYLFADPSVRAAIAVAFLNGVQTPTVEADEAVFNTLGMQWRSYMDFGVGMEDPVAAARSNGT